ncbi:hypothetical protein [Orrella marina]|uniref:hypothetical protein n=1 Tax=Orrella marina TaxID=2163011 RepID=UPI00131EE74A|nr:hypothetical protein [Orrella marina]
MTDLLKQILVALKSIDNRLARMERQPQPETLRYPSDLDGAHHVAEPRDRIMGRRK